MNDAVLLGSPETGPPVAQVVGVGARQERVVLPAGGECRQLRVQLGLAVVAAVAIVPSVLRPLELGRRDRLVPDTDRAGDVAGAVELARRQRRRNGGDGERPVA